MACPLCFSGATFLYDQDRLRSYFKCETCALVFVDRGSVISPQQEKERYEAHENSENNSDYRDYLSSIAQSIRPHLKNGDVGLDFGSGKTKILSELLMPHVTFSYDVYFLPDDSLLKRKYDFIILSEVIEHLRDPLRIMEDLKKCLNPQGQFFIKTKFYPERREDFGNWFYKRDITHIQFFCQMSFEKLSSLLGLQEVLRVGDDLFIIR